MFSFKHCFIPPNSAVCIAFLEKNKQNQIFSSLEPLFRLTPKDLNLPANPTDQNATSSSGKVNIFLSLIHSSSIFSYEKVRKIIVELQRLFAEMLLLNQQACSSIRLTESFGWQSNEVGVNF
jgi:hypothetical protein